MTFDISVDSIEMSDGTTVSVPHSGVVVFVGPNNSGKSLSLRNMYAHLYQGADPPRAIKGVKVEKSGTADDLASWLEAAFALSFQRGQKGYYVYGSAVEERFAKSWWDSGPPFHDLMRSFVFFAAGEGRLQAVNPSDSFDARRDQPVHPLQIMYKNPDLEKKLSDICVRAFGEPLFLDRFAGNSLYLSLGQPPAPPENVMPPPKEYLDQIAAFPTVDQQGDGMKSFIGLMLHLLTVPYRIILVDEPEAFLHPPQARLIGRLLVEENPAEAQVFVATHDSDVLTGVLDVHEASITVVRLDWDGEVNHASQLDPEKVKDLWQDPLLRYSNILDGLFHEAVVLCEGDADCRYYQSVLDDVQAEESETEEAEVRRPDLLFTHCGGKDRMPMVIDALGAVRVPVRVIADFDVLREETLLRRIVEGLDGNWNLLKSDWSVVKRAVDNISKASSTDYVREEIGKALSKITTRKLQKSDEEELRKLIRVESGWDEAKRYGMSAVPAGDATSRVERLIANLREIGLFVVQEGQLEGFVRSVGNHGPRWVNEVHRRELHADRTLIKPRRFVRSVADSVAK